MDRDHPESASRSHTVTLCVRCDGEIATFSENLLAGCAILLVGYDGEVTSDRPQAGEDLRDRNKTLKVAYRHHDMTSVAFVIKVPQVP